jgi:hypothetical protein
MSERQKGPGQWTRMAGMSNVREFQDNERCSAEARKAQAVGRWHWIIEAGANRGEGRAESERSEDSW